MMNATRMVDAPAARAADEEVLGWDEEWSTLSEEPDDEEIWDEELIDEEGLGSLSMFEARRSRPRRTPTRPIRRTSAPTFAGGVASVQIPTQRGPIQATLNERFVTPQQLTEALRKLEENTAKNFADTKREVQRVDQSSLTRDEETRRDAQRGLATQNKLLKRHVRETKRAYGTLKREVNDVRQTSLMMALLNKPEDLQSLTLTQPPSPSSTTLTVANTQYKERNNLLPILLLSGGLGSSGSDSNTLMMVLALSGGL